jgi:PLP dependent protein
MTDVFSWFIVQSSYTKNKQKMFDPVYKYNEIRAKIDSLGEKYRRKDKIKILVATKYVDVDVVNELIKGGVELIGENRVQDARDKFDGLLPVKKHFIGHLQSNKVKEAVSMFDVIESVDSIRMAHLLNEAAGRVGKILPVYLQVNVAGEKQKFGFKEDEILRAYEELAALCNVDICGLMAIMPNVNELLLEGYFIRMKDLFDSFKAVNPRLKVLSMGMSNDYMLAIKHGATQVRIGSLLFT